MAILDAIRSNRFCPKSSTYPHSHYTDYVEFLFATGCRPGEVIGLQRKHVDLEQCQVTIESVLARGDRGQSNSASRVRKETKTGNVRILTLTPHLLSLLQRVCTGLQPDDLVFPSPKGKAIDDRLFRRLIWKPILEALGIEYRRPYMARHTFASHAIEQGVSLTNVAYLLGHTDTTMVCRVYGHIINRPTLPDIFRPPISSTNPLIEH